jgi:hypothetical protein
MPGEQLLLINPRRRRRRHARRHVSRRRHANPVRHHRRHRRHAARLANPRRRRHVMRSRRSNPRRRRNPFSTTGLTNDYLMPGALGALGGVALNLLWNAISPSLGCTISGNSITSVLAQGAGAIGLGMIAGKALGASKGQAVGAGALTIVLYNYANSMLSTTGGLMGLGRRRGMGRRGMGAYMPGTQIPRLNGMGAYLPGQGLNLAGLGNYAAMNPAPYLAGGAEGMGMF